LQDGAALFGSASAAEKNLRKFIADLCSPNNSQYTILNKIKFKLNH
jgi:hypothetical protein